MSGVVLTILITVCCVPKKELLLAIGPLWTVPASAMFYVGTLGKKVTNQITATYSNLRRQKVRSLQ